MKLIINIKNILEEIKSARSKSYTSAADIKLILNAMELNDWSQVKKSNLYKLHGGEYCELLGIIHRYANG